MELRPLEQREVGVLGELEYSVVEVEPAQLAIEEPVVGKIARFVGVWRVDVIRVVRRTDRVRLLDLRCRR
jgi:hypothetical protein